jgi:hypothetical protein
MWNIPGKSVSANRFQPFQPADVLYDFDGPRIFTLRDTDGELNLAYWSDENDQLARYVVVPTTARILDALQDGGISVYDALNQPRCWLCDVTHQDNSIECQRVEFDAIPRDALPNASTMLLSTLMPPLVSLEGRIRELDKDRLSFELREIEGAVKTQRFIFDRELLEQVFLAFEDEVRVRVAGRTNTIKNVAQALALSRLNGETGTGSSAT